MTSCGLDLSWRHDTSTCRASMCDISGKNAQVCADAKVIVRRTRALASYMEALETVVDAVQSVPSHRSAEYAARRNWEVFAPQGLQPTLQKLESNVSTFWAALNLAVIGSLVKGVMSRYFVFWGSITRRSHRSS